MDARNLVRAVLDLLDTVDQKHPQEPAVEPIVDAEPGEQGSRFKQIFAILDNRRGAEYSNTPTEVVAPMDAVTSQAGGGLNGPKHPHDIRVKDPSAYPDQQEY